MAVLPSKLAEIVLATLLYDIGKFPQLAQLPFRRKLFWSHKKDADLSEEEIIVKPICGICHIF
ncbi:MAG: hypothetical protein LWW78_01480 [Deltaproteobacteria bacterium]|nr:hypothetical protein [Deltaproteobacteria bacterium]